MRIGLVLFGHLRSYRQTLSSFELLKQTLQRSGIVDVFCHTWDIEESVTASWWKEHKENEAPPATVSAIQIEEAFQPANYFIEPSKQFDDSDYTIKSSIPVAGILSMLYSQRHVFDQLKQYEEIKGFKYDVVIKTRYDLLYEIAPGFSQLVENCSSNDMVYLPFSNPYELVGSFSDIFAIGSREEMEKYFSFCTNFKEAASLYSKQGYRLLLPELCMTIYLESMNIKRHELMGLRLHILRRNGEKFQINSDKNFTNNGPLCFHNGTIAVCKEILPSSSGSLIENSPRLAKKYMSWVDKDADNLILQQYADLYAGKWIPVSITKRLATKGYSNPVFERPVMRSFFEASIRNAKYNFAGKFLLASILSSATGYSLFFFRVLKKILSGKV